MAITRKITREVATIKEGTAGVYQAPSVRVPYTTFDVKQSFTMIPDESIMGIAFPSLPRQGVRAVAISGEQEYDVATAEVMLELCLGALSSHVASCPADANIIMNSFIEQDGVKTNKYAGVMCTKWELFSAPDKKLMLKYDLLGWKAEVRDDTGMSSITTDVGAKLTHSDLSGTGYFRVGDQTNALETSTDDIDVEDVSISIDWKCTNQYANAIGTLLLLSGSGGRPSAEFKFKVARHLSDNYKIWRDAHTHLQAEYKYYVSSAASCLVQIPNFVITDVSDSDEDIPKVEVTGYVSRNGTGSTYENSNMAFVTPVRITNDNA